MNMYSDDECEQCNIRDRYFTVLAGLTDMLTDSDEDNDLTEDELTDTEDDMSVDLEDYEEADTQDLIDGEKEYQKFKHTLSDFIIDDLLEDEEEFQPQTKRKRIEK